MTEQGHIFISYKSQEFAYAAKIRDQLQAWSYATWLDKDKLKAGRDWQKSIDDALRSSAAVVGIITPAALNSHMVRAEWSLAFAKGIPFIPLRFADCELTYPCNSLQYIDFTNDEAAALAQLKAALVDAKPQTPQDPYFPYLDKFYDYITELFRAKIITREADERPEPISLHMEISEGMVDAPVERHESDNDMFAALFAVEGIVTDKPESQTLYHDFQSAFEHYDGRILLLGEPGAGKTITLLNAARDAVVRRIQDPHQPLPLFGLISTWDSIQQPSLSDWLASWGKSLLKADDLSRMIAYGDTLLLLDGLDELGGERTSPPDPLCASSEGEKFDPRKSFIAQIPANNQVLLTCREKDYAEIGQKIPLKGAVTLKPLDDGQMRTYLAEQPELWVAVQADAELKAMLTTPLLLSFFGFAYQGMTTDERQQLTDLSKSPGDLRDKIFEYYVRERYRHEELKVKARGEMMPFTLKEIYDLLGHTAVENITDQVWWENRIKDKDFMPLFDYDYTRVKFFTDMVTRLNLLAKGDMIWNQSTFHFAHLLLRNYFAFRYATNAIESEDSEDAHLSIEALGVLQDTRGVPFLIDTLHHLNADNRMNAASVLGELGDPQAIYPLIEALDDETEEVRSTAIDALVKLHDPGTLDVFVSQINDGDVDEDILQAIEALAYPASILLEALPIFLELLRENPFHPTLIQILGKIADTRALEELHNQLDSKDSYIRVIALHAIRNIKSPKSVHTVAKILHRDNIPYLRRDAARILGIIGHPDAIPFLIEALSDEVEIPDVDGQIVLQVFVERVCDVAVQALERIGTPEALAAVEEWRKQQGKGDVG